MYWNSDEHSASDDNDRFDKEKLEETNHTYNFGSDSSWLDFKVGKLSAAGLAENWIVLRNH